MADSKHFRILKQGVKAFDGWRGKNPDIVSNLVKADLRQAIFVNTIITSRTLVTLLRRALTDEQKSTIIFSGEREIAPKKAVLMVGKQ